MKSLVDLGFITPHLGDTASGAQSGQAISGEQMPSFHSNINMAPQSPPVGPIMAPQQGQPPMGQDQPGMYMGQGPPPHMAMGHTPSQPPYMMPSGVPGQPPLMMGMPPMMVGVGAPSHGGWPHGQFPPTIHAMPSQGALPHPHPQAPHPAPKRRKLVKDVIGDRDKDLGRMVNRLYSDFPLQCAACGLRFKDKEKMGKHLDWHFAVNKKEKQKTKKAVSRLWYLTSEVCFTSPLSLSGSTLPSFLCL